MITEKKAERITVKIEYVNLNFMPWNGTNTMTMGYAHRILDNIYKVIDNNFKTYHSSSTVISTGNAVVAVYDLEYNQDTKTFYLRLEAPFGIYLSLVFLINGSDRIFGINGVPHKIHQLNKVDVEIYINHERIFKDISKNDFNKYHIEMYHILLDLWDYDESLRSNNHYPIYAIDIDNIQKKMNTNTNLNLKGVLGVEYTEDDFKPKYNIDERFIDSDRNLKVKISIPNKRYLKTVNKILKEGYQKKYLDGFSITIKQ